MRLTQYTGNSKIGVQSRRTLRQWPELAFFMILEVKASIVCSTFHLAEIAPTALHGTSMEQGIGSDFVPRIIFDLYKS